MQNSFAARCTFCRRFVGIGQGVVLRRCGRLFAYCAEHDDGPERSHAELFARDTLLRGARPNDARSFDDGSSVVWSGGRWIVSTAAPAPVSENA